MQFFSEFGFSIFCLSIWSGTVTAQRQEIFIYPGPAENETKIYIYIEDSFRNLSGLLTGGSELSDDQSIKMFTYQLDQRQGDAYLFNHVKYFINLVRYVEALRGNPRLPPLLPLHPRPLDNLMKPCTFPPGEYDNEILTDFLNGRITEEDLMEYPKDIIPCTPPTYMPVLQCFPTHAVPDPITGTPQLHGMCICSEETVTTKWTSFVYRGVPGVEGTPTEGQQISCLGELGSLCDNASLTCADGIECQGTEKGPSYCGGSIGKLARGFGGSIRFTDRQLADILKSRRFSSQDELENYLIRISNSIGIHGRDCNPDYWDWAAGQLFKVLKLIKKVNMTESDVDGQGNMYLEVLEYLGALEPHFKQYYLASVIKFMKFLDDPELQTHPQYRQLTQLRSEYYDLNDYCLNEFPRMACIKKKTDPQRGLCLCASSNETGSRAFNYFLEDGQCVGGVGAVCTTVRGSGDHACAKGLVCEPYVEDELREIRIPGPGAHLEIHICNYPKGNTGTNGTNNQTAQDQGQTNGSVQISDTSVLFLEVIVICLIFKNFGVQVLTKLANYQKKSA